MVCWNWIILSKGNLSCRPSIIIIFFNIILSFVQGSVLDLIWESWGKDISELEGPAKTVLSKDHVLGGGAGSTELLVNY